MKYKEYKNKLKEEYNTFEQEEIVIKKKSVHKRFIPLYVICSVVLLIIALLTINHISVSSYNQNLDNEIKNHYDNISIVNDLKKVTSKKDITIYNKEYRQSFIDVIVDSSIKSINQLFNNAIQIPENEMSGVPSTNVPELGKPTEIDTNSQVKGIDEADIAKCDEKYVYYLVNSNLYIYKHDGTIITQTRAIPGEMFIYNDKIIIIGGKIKIFEFKDNILTEVYKSDNKVSDSRLINNNLFIVTNNYSLDDVDYDNCYYDEYTDVNCIFRISKINLDNMEIDTVDNANNGLATLYMSNEYIVLATRINFPYYCTSSFTLSSVFDTDLNPIGTFKSKGTVLNQFSIDIYNDTLRIVGTDNWADDNKLNSITIFDLKNKIQLGFLDDGIGEQRQIVKSVRFQENKCFIVTYKNTDPLYEIDLSDSTNPKIIDIYKAPGYSSYLHNFVINDKKYILGLGLTDDLDYKISIYEDKEENIQIGKDFIISQYIYEGVGLKQDSFYPLFSNHKALFIYNDDINIYLGTNVDYNSYVIFKIDVTNPDKVVSIYMDIEVNYETRCFLVEGKLLIPNIESLIIKDLY